MSKENNANFKEILWKSADKLRNQMDAAEYKHIVLGLIFLKYISDTFLEQRQKTTKLLSDPKSNYFISKDPKDFEKDLEDRDYYTKDNIFWVPKKARWEYLRSQAKQPDIGSIIDKSMTIIENENKSLRNKLDKRFGRSQIDSQRMGELIDLISTIGFSKKRATDVLGEIYEYFLGQFALAEGKKGGQFYTPASVVKILVEVLTPYKGRIYDPCCGSGGMFVQSEKFLKSHGGRVEDISIYGQESNPTTWKLAAMNMAIRSLSANLGIESNDTFGKDQFPNIKFDYILANPHFNDSDWGGEKYENDARWKYGKPSNGNANYAWLQHIIWKLKPGGKAGVVLANGSLTSEFDIRKGIIQDDLLEIMIVLPDKLFFNTGIPACLWFLTKDKEKNNLKKNKSLFIDARNMGEIINRKNKILSDNDIKKIKDIVSKWRLNKGYDDINGFCKESDLKDIEENNFDLNPAKYINYDFDEHKKIDLDKEKDDFVNKYKILIKENSELDSKIFKYLKKIKK